MSTSQKTPTVPRTTFPTQLAGSRWLALPVLLTGTFMVVLDFFIVNVALPSIQSRLHAGTAPSSGWWRVTR